jgi:hypothetical protein
MRNISLTSIAKEILEINEMLPCMVGHEFIVDCPGINMFRQVWGNTSGGHEGIGGSAMTDQMTYVIDLCDRDGNVTYFVFFGGRLGYRIASKDATPLFFSDLNNRALHGCSSYKNFYLKDRTNEKI